MAELLQKLAQPTPAPSNPEQTIEALATNTFEKWFSRYEDIFDSDVRNLEDAAKVRLLLRKLDTPAYTRQLELIKECDTPKEIWETLKNVFERKGVAGQLYVRKQLLTMRYVEGAARIKNMIQKLFNVM
ncbi:uncharacterized protein LOC134221417 [Armigeres subalbatus]|uniref:uncharacterized protein LOC134221417 n=1 Tax=Armigeres subalbatus TaxID=124917 RepID=UPI002ED080A5